jgi:hypothetical protein
MIYARLIGTAVAVLVLVYYIFVVLQCFGLIRFSHEKITFPKVLIPFYYFFK